MAAPVAKIYSINAVSVNSEATLVTPTSGKTLTIRRLILTNSGTAGNLVLKDNTAGTTVATIYLPASTSANCSREIDLAKDDGVGITLSAADYVLTGTLSSGTISGLAFCTEQ